MKKSLLLILLVVMVFSCKQEEILDQNTATADFTADISMYDNSNLGLYKGTFTTLDATERGIVEIKILNNVPSKATLSLVSGATFNLNSRTIVNGQGDTNIKFSTVDDTALNVTFDFSVNFDGSSPAIANALLGNRASDILVFKETSRGPVTVINGTWTCDTDCLPNMVGTNQTFNVAGTGGALTPQATLDLAVFTGSATQSASVVQGDFEVASITGTVQVPQSPGNPDTDIVFTATHRWRTGAPDCSTINGTWSYESPSAPGVPSSGTLVSDVTGPNCPPPGDSVGGAIPLPIVGPGVCVGNDLSLELGTGGYTASGVASTCAILGNNDIFFTWTATTDAMTIMAGTGSNLTNPQVTIYDFTGGVLGAEVKCTNGSNLGAVTSSGWSVNDELLVRVSASGNIGICFEEFTLPPPSANDLCVDAIAIACGDVVMGNTVSDSDDHNSFQNRGNDVYYTYTEGAEQQTITISLCGSSFDTSLFVYDDGCSFASIIAENEDFCGATNGQSEVTFISNASTTYTIVVDGYGSGGVGTGANGAFSLSLTCEEIEPFTCGDQIVDTGGPGGDYGLDEKITYNVDAGVGMVPTVSFTEFSIENGWDFMRFYDGTDVNATEITTSDGGLSVIAGTGFTGSDLDGDSITATQQFLTVVFQSDNFGVDTGYIGDITCSVPLTGGGTGRQEYKVISNRKAVVRTEAEYAERRAKANELKMKSKMRRANQR